MLYLGLKMKLFFSYAFLKIGNKSYLIKLAFFLFMYSQLYTVSIITVSTLIDKYDQCESLALLLLLLNKRR